MRIFHCVESYFPAVGGMQEVVKQLSERLVVLGHEVIVLTRFHPDRNFELLNGVKVISFKVEGNPKEVVSDAEKEYVSFLLNQSSDIITFFAAQQWATDLALPILGKLNAKKVSVPTGYSGLYRSEYTNYFEKMKQYIHGYDMNVYLSNNYRDINFARENKVSNAKIIIIPNGAAEDEFENIDFTGFRKEHAIPENDFLILHVGSYTGDKGHREAVSMFFKANIKNATLLFIGNKYEYFIKRSRYKYPLLLLRWMFAGFKNKKVIFSFLSRTETVKAFKSADLFLFPSNIECSPIVLFEAMAGHTGFLVSDVGNSKEIIEWSKAGILIPTKINQKGRSVVVESEGKKLIEELYSHPNKLKELSANGYKVWREKFTWEKITKQYEVLYKQLILNK
ncbi:MAG: glycosyltransferase family 4 protein [Bacteroidota bacterium]|nr:glycosyltransferase family 4 protein [Bacteroidota bacterium]